VLGRGGGAQFARGLLSGPLSQVLLDFSSASGANASERNGSNTPKPASATKVAATAVPRFTASD